MPADGLAFGNETLFTRQKWTSEEVQHGQI